MNVRDEKGEKFLWRDKGSCLRLGEFGRLRHVKLGKGKSFNPVGLNAGQVNNIISNVSVYQLLSFRDVVRHLYLSESIVKRIYSLPDIVNL